MFVFMLKIVLFLILALVLLVIIIWIVGAFLTNDFYLQTKNIQKYKKILIIFPHADDEVLHTIGLIRNASQYVNKTTWVILTKGERGTHDAHVDNNLKAIRTKEAQEAAKIYGVTKLIQEDFGDDRLHTKRKELTGYIETLIKNEKPDLIVTYDLAGEYGHPDHIIVSEITTELVKKKYKNTVLWYATYPKLIYNMGNFPTHMAQDPNFMKRRAPAQFKIFLGWNIIKKIQATYVYKSQFQSFQSAIPYNIPPWYVFSMFICEYYNAAN